MIKVMITDRAGAVLKTSGKYCKEDILVSPITQDKTVDIITNGRIVVSPDGGYCGLTDLIIKVDVPIHDYYINAEGVSF